MKGLCVLLMSVFLSSAAVADDYVIDDYSFKWEVESFGDVKLALEKSNDALKVIVTVKRGIGMDSLYLTPSEAVGIGEALKSTEEYYKKQKGAKEDVSDTVKAGNYDIRFSTSVKYGFGVHVKEKRMFSSGVYMERKEARKLSKLLRESEEMAGFLDKQVDF